MQRVAAWKSWALFIGMFCAVLLAREAVTTLVPAAATTLLAQDEPAGGAADAPAGGGGAPGGSEGPRRQQTYLGWFFEALGITYSLAFLFISFTFVAVLVMNLLSVRRDAICPRHLAEAFEAHLNEKKFQEAFDLAKSDESMLGQMLASGMQNLQTGYDKAVDAMGTVGEEENLKLEHRLSYISLIGTHQPDGRPVRHGTRHGRLVPGDRHRRHDAQGLRPGQGHFDRPVHHARGPGHRHPGDRRLQPCSRTAWPGWCSKSASTAKT
jgi:hypothetical protein